jgi:hypothetical protein
MRPWNWLATMLMADPVIKPVIAGAGMNSTTQPMRRIPMPRATNPHKNARLVAISEADQVLGLWESTALMIWATVNDMIAVGPIEISLEVAKSYGGLHIRNDRQVKKDKDIHSKSELRQKKNIVRTEPGDLQAGDAVWEGT